MLTDKDRDQVLKDLMEVVQWQFAKLPQPESQTEVAEHVQMSVKLAQVQKFFETVAPTQGGFLTLNFAKSSARDHKIEMIKAVRTIGALGLKEAKDFVEQGIASPREVYLDVAIDANDPRLDERIRQEIEQLRSRGVSVNGSASLHGHWAGFPSNGRERKVTLTLSWNGAANWKTLKVMMDSISDTTMKLNRSLDPNIKVELNDGEFGT